MRERETNEKKKEMNKRRWQSDRAKKPFILTYMYPSIFIQTMLMVDPLPDRCVVGFCCDPPTPSITSTPAGISIGDAANTMDATEKNAQPT